MVSKRIKDLICTNYKVIVMGCKVKSGKRLVTDHTGTAASLNQILSSWHLQIHFHRSLSPHLNIFIINFSQQHFSSTPFINMRHLEHKCRPIGWFSAGSKAVLSNLTKADLRIDREVLNQGNSYLLWNPQNQIHWEISLKWFNCELFSFWSSRNNWCL